MPPFRRPEPSRGGKMAPGLPAQGIARGPQARPEALQLVLLPNEPRPLGACRPVVVPAHLDVFTQGQAAGQGEGRLGVFQSAAAGGLGGRVVRGHDEGFPSEITCSIRVIRVW